MAAPKTNQNPSDFEEYIRDLLECPICLDTIKLMPIYQCTNGHLICKDCIKKLNNCPICRNDSPLARNLQLENIVQRLKGIQPKNGATTAAKPNLQKWGNGSVRSYGTINGPNQDSHIEINLRASPGQVKWPSWVMPGWATTGWATPGWVMPTLATPRQTVSRPVNDQNVEASVPGQDLSRSVNNQDVWAPLQGDTWSNCILKMILAAFLCVLIVFLFFGLLHVVGNFDFI